MNVHKSVLLNETIEGLNLHPGVTLLDGTIGGGGHAATAAELFRNDISIIGLDMDQEALHAMFPHLKEKVA